MTDTNYRLVEFEVFGLFGEFNHRIPLKLAERVTAIIAPNGRGKTACLRLIKALFARQWTVFSNTEFERIEYKFDNGIVLFIERMDDLPDGGEGSSFPIRFRLQDPKQPEPTFWTPQMADLPRSRLLHVERYIPWLTRTGPARWTDDNSGQTLTLQELIETYSDVLPDHITSGFYADEPSELTRLITAIDCHLIETQRLILFTDEDQRYRRGRSPRRYAIQEKAEKLANIISEELTRYAALSQTLDRSFPRRAIQSSYQVSPVDDLKSKLATLDDQRRLLMSAGILDTDSNEQVELPPGEIDPAIARVLSVYVHDTERKLQTLAALREKVTLFKDLIESRFSGKVVNVSKQNGFTISYRDKTVPLEKLSSGEQHQLVLFFELLFELKNNALILIDEPELSLHVSWQKRFIGDLRRIIDLNIFDVVLATHSPQLIGRWLDLSVDLGGVDDE